MTASTTTPVVPPKDDPAATGRPLESTYRRSLMLEDRRWVSVRPIEAADRPALARAVIHLSVKSRYSRFLGAIRQLSPALLDRLTAVDHHEHEALIALDGGGSIVAIARYIRAAKAATAELAVTVADEWQSDGLGIALVALLIDRAREEGIEAFTGDMLSANNRMADLLREYGAPRVSPSADGVEAFVLDLPNVPMAPHIPELLARARPGPEEPRRSKRDHRRGAPSTTRT